MSKYLVNKKNKQIFNGIIPRYEGKILYNSSSGNNDQITIKNKDEYKYMDIIYTHDGYCQTTRIYREQYNIPTNIVFHRIKDTTFIIYCNTWKFIDNTFSRTSGSYLYMQPSGFKEIGNSDHIKITKIIGYK